MPKLTAIVAMTSDRIIGRKNDLPWHLPEDLKLFKRTTMGHPIVMGRKTWDSIGKALPGRQNIVLTRDRDWSAEGVTVIHSPQEIEQIELQDEHVFIIGGAQVYQIFLPYVEDILVSHVFEDHEGDTRFPEFSNIFTHQEILESYDNFELRHYTRQWGTLKLPATVDPKKLNLVESATTAVCHLCDSSQFEWGVLQGAMGTQVGFKANNHITSSRVKSRRCMKCGNIQFFSQ